jgi:hypothetical protein
MCIFGDFTFADVKFFYLFEDTIIYNHQIV